MGKRMVCWQTSARRFGVICGLCAFLLLGGIGARVQALAAAEEPKKSEETEEEKKKKEKPKEPPFKYSAWCAFRDYADVQKPPPTPNADPMRNDQSRPGSGQWGGYARHGKWISLVVELQNTTEKEEFNGTMRIRLDPTPESTETGEKPYTTRYRQEFQLPPVTTKRFNFSVLCPEYIFSQIQIDITTNGRTYTRYVSLNDLDANPKRPEELVVVVSEESGAFKFLLSKSRSNPDGTEEESGINRNVAVVRPLDLPERWHDLTLANLIIIDNPPREGFSDAQLEALEAYCQAGGHLLIGAGKDPSRLTAREGQKRSLADLAGVKVNGTAAVAQIDLLQPPYRGAGQDWTMPIVDVSLAPGVEHAYVSKNSGKEGYIEQVQRVVGLGSVTFLAFSLSDDQIQAWAGRQQIPLYILENFAHAPLFGLEDPNLESRMGSNVWGWPTEVEPTGPDRGTLFKLRKDVDESYTRDTPVETQSRRFVASFLLLFLLAAVPGNYLIFGWFKRREIAWLAVPLWAVGFSVAAYFIGYYGRVGKLTVNELCVVEAGPGQRLAVGRTFMGIYSPRRGQYRLAFGDENESAESLQAGPGHLIRDLRTRGITDVLPELDIVDVNGSMVIEDLLVQARSTRRLEINHRVDLNDGIHAKMEAKKVADGKTMYELTYRNGATRQLIGAALIHHAPDGLKGFPLGSLDARQLEPVVRAIPLTSDKAWMDISEAFFKDAPKFRYARGPDATDRGRAILEFLRARINVYGQTVLVGWFDGGILPVQVDGEEPGSSRGMTLVIVPFPAEIGATASRAARARRVTYSPDFDIIPATETWKKPVRGQPIKLAARGVEEGVMSFRVALSDDDLKSSAKRKLVVRFNLVVLDRRVLGQDDSYYAQYKGKAMLEVLERSGNQPRWTPLTCRTTAANTSEIDLSVGERSEVLTFEIPYTPSMATGRNLTFKVRMKDLKALGAGAELDSEWNLAVETIQMDLEGPGGIKAEQE
ncbi:MAG: hypothetical protein KIS92_11990 [Planctomycetota bacterium]|nr:hypothetical protein [Planctomycetota bacterium]